MLEAPLAVVVSPETDSDQPPFLAECYNSEDGTNQIESFLSGILRCVFADEHKCGIPTPSVQFTDRFHKKETNWAASYTERALLIQINRSAFDPIKDKPQELSEALRSVILHELCHHVQYWRHRRTPIAPHGKEFREALRQVNCYYGEEIVTVYHSLRMKTLSPRLHRKALALLSLTTSPNEHEAALAAARFTEFQLKYEVELSPEAQALQAGLPPMDDQCFYVAKQASTWLRKLFSAIADTHACKLYWRKNSDCSATRFFLVGRETKIAQAYEVAQYLVQAIDRAVDREKFEAKKEKSLARRGRSYFMAFREGAAQAVASSLRLQHKSRLADGLMTADGVGHIPGLVLASHFEKERAAVDEFLKAEKYRFRSTSAVGSRSFAGRVNGRAAGSRIGVGPQVSSGAPRSLPSSNRG